MATTNNPYCTLQQVKDSLDIQSTDRDAWIEGDLMPQAQARIDEYLGFSFQTDGTDAAPVTRTFNGNGATQLPIGDCVSVSQVIETTYDIGVNANGDYTRSSHQSDITADCVLGPANMDVPFLLERYSGEQFFLGRRNYSVSGVWGRSSIPADITRACVRLVGHWIRMQDSAYTDTAGEQQFGKLTYRVQMPGDVVEILDAYRRRLFLAWP